jgi:hypothetical protein
MKITKKKLNNIIQKELNDVIKEARYYTPGGKDDPFNQKYADDPVMASDRGAEDEGWGSQRRTTERYDLEVAMQNAIGEFVWGEEGIVGQIRDWMSEITGQELPGGFESPTQIVNTEFGRAIRADETLQKLLRGIIDDRGEGRINAPLAKAIRNIPGFAEMEEYDDMYNSQTAGDPASFAAYDIARYMAMKLL